MLRNDSLVDTVFLFYMRSKGQTAYYIQEIESADLNQTHWSLFTRDTGRRQTNQIGKN
jgi:hypothetical protein